MTISQQDARATYSFGAVFDSYLVADLVPLIHARDERTAPIDDEPSAPSR